MTLFTNEQNEKGPVNKMKKTSLQDIANAVGISRVTAWKVFCHRDGVSEDIKQRVIAKAIELNYENIPDDLRNSAKLVNPVSATPVVAAEEYTISVAVSRPETSAFWMTIIHEMAKEASKHNINLMYTYLPSVVTPEYELPPILTNGTIQGVIVLNVYNEALVRRLSALSVPKVFMDTCTTLPFRELNGDLLLIEGLSGIAEIVDSLVKKGKKTFGFIGDINYAQTNYERYRGFVHSLEEHNLKLNKDFCMTGRIGVDTYVEEIHSFINKLDKLPDAFICVSDFVASIVYRDLKARGLSIPEDIALSGFDGNAEIIGADEITTVQVHNSDIGIRLVRQILYRMQSPNACHEICYLCSDVVFKKSTDC